MGSVIFLHALAQLDKNKIKILSGACSFYDKNQQKTDSDLPVFSTYSQMNRFVKKRTTRAEKQTHYKGTHLNKT